MGCPPFRPRKIVGKVRKAFLDHLRKHGVIAAAARAVNVGTATVKDTRRRDPTFEQQVHDAQEEAMDAIEVRAHEMAADEKDGPMIRYLLSCKRPEKYSQRYQLEHGGTVDVTGEITVTIVEDENWYGNDAHDKAAQGIASSVRSAAESSTVQGSGLRPALGQNGNGANGSH